MGGLKSKAKKFVKNAAAIATAPTTGGLSLLATDWGKSKWKEFSGQKAQEEANLLNLAEAQKNRDWQERMSNTAITRQMQDLMNAGINPNLAATLGGASVGSGAQGTVSPVPSTSQTLAQGAGTIASLGSGFSSIAGGLKTLTENKYVPEQQKSQIANTVANTALTQAQTVGTQAGTERTKAETQQINELKLKIKEETRNLKKSNDYNDFIKLPDNAPQGIRYIMAMSAASGLNGNKGSSEKSAVEEIKEIKDWLNKHGIETLPFTPSIMKTAYYMFKSDGH